MLLSELLAEEMFRAGDGAVTSITELSHRGCRFKGKSLVARSQALPENGGKYDVVFSWRVQRVQINCCGASS